jgi:transposase
MKAIAMDLRLRVLAACDDGWGTAEVAEQFSVSPAWVRRLKQRRRETGEIGPRRPARFGPRRTLEGHDERLGELVRANPGLDAEEYRDRLGVRVAVITVWRALRRLGLSFKKSPSAPASRTARTSPLSATSGEPRSPRRWTPTRSSSSTKRGPRRT